MKNGKNPTRKQKEIIKKARLNPNNWLVVKSLDKRMYLVNRETKRQKLIFV